MSVFEIKNDTVLGILEHISPYLHGKRDALVRILACVFSGGHMLLEDLPGLGKTTLAVAAARALGLSFGRVQCTNDLLPTDVTGLNVFKAERGEFEFHPGPIFNNLVLVDEINRASPKTQSALLESMGEEQATIDGVTYRLAEPFFVIATQNPIEHSGTFPLPESQMDRFMMRTSIGYPDRDSEKDILRLGLHRHSIDGLSPLMSAAVVMQIQEEIEHDVKAGDRILDYILSLAETTRAHPLITCGISTRGAMVLLKCARCVAWMQGRDFVIPEDVKAFAEDVLLHRLRFREESRYEGPAVLRSVLSGTPVM
ncbi:MAG: MoxR family ATPase [Synergistaceae bacterium]|jgi:MoxR-like ATPase|nr:MoxR family ATPase [Synergistaceae bacterium]